MKRLCVLVSAAVLLAFGMKSTAVARQALVALPLVDHPVLSPVKPPIAPAYKKMLGSWGEDFAEQTLRLRGYQVRKPGYHGFDWIAVKHAPDGVMKELKLVEVKVTKGNNFQLSNTKYGRQMSHRWLAHKLKKMRQTGDPDMKRLALQIGRFRSASARPIESFGEVMHINARAGEVAFYMADGETITASSSLERLLKDIQKRASSKDDRRWAGRALEALDQIGAGRMSDWISPAAVVSPSRRIAMRMILARAAGPIAALVGLGAEAKQFIDVELAYRRGFISLRDRNISHVAAIGGLAGGATGFWLGMLGGPFFEITAPVGAVVGATIGGIGGHFAARYVATEWYRSIDSRVRERIELHWVSLPFPASKSGSRQ